MHYDFIEDSELAHQWATSCLNLLGRVFGKESDHYSKFESLFTKLGSGANLVKMLGILKGAKDDFENGFLFETRSLIQAEVFDDFLEQADHLLEKGYFAPAAVIAGGVLEDGLRKLCLRQSISLPAKPTIDPMNVELVKTGIYNTLEQKRITALADLRNKAAHGKWAEFSEKDVEMMISQVRAFMEKHFT